MPSLSSDSIRVVIPCWAAGCPGKMKPFIGHPSTYRCQTGSLSIVRLLKRLQYTYIVLLLFPLGIGENRPLKLYANNAHIDKSAWSHLCMYVCMYKNIVHPLIDKSRQNKTMYLLYVAKYWRGKMLATVCSSNFCRINWWTTSVLHSRYIFQRQILARLDFRKLATIH